MLDSIVIYFKRQFVIGRRQEHCDRQIFSTIKHKRIMNSGIPLADLHTSREAAVFFFFLYSINFIGSSLVQSIAVTTRLTSATVTYMTPYTWRSDANVQSSSCSVRARRLWRNVTNCLAVDNDNAMSSNKPLWTPVSAIDWTVRIHWTWLVAPASVREFWFPVPLCFLQLAPAPAQSGFRLQQRLAAAVLLLVRVPALVLLLFPPSSPSSL